MSAADFEPLTVIGRGAFGEASESLSANSALTHISVWSKKHYKRFAFPAGPPVQREGEWQGSGSEEVAKVRDAATGTGWPR